MMSREEIAEVAVQCLSLKYRPDGFLRVAGKHEAFVRCGYSPVEYLYEGARGDEVRWFADELHRLSDRFLALAEG
jgi:hypothetical protein